MRSCGNCASQKAPRVVLLALSEGRLVFPVCPLSASPLTFPPPCCPPHCFVTRACAAWCFRHVRTPRPLPHLPPPPGPDRCPSPSPPRRRYKLTVLSRQAPDLTRGRWPLVLGPHEPPLPRRRPRMGSPGPKGSSFLCSLKLNAPPLRASPKTPSSGEWITYTWNPDFAF